jgi:hypothetical protein
MNIEEIIEQQSVSNPSQEPERTLLTADQLAYVLERKYVGIRIGVDALVTCTVTMERDEYGELPSNNDGFIAEWNLKDIPKPTVEQIMQWWEILSEQYHSDPQRIDSDMRKFVRSKQPKPTITINEDI